MADKMRDGNPGGSEGDKKMMPSDRQNPPSASW